MLQKPLASRIPQPRRAEPTAPRRRPAQPRIPDEAYELGYRVCTDGWQEAVAGRLAGALDRRAWDAIRKRPSGLCDELERTARKVEEASAASGEAAGVAAATATRWLRLPRIVQKIAQTIVEKAVPPTGEEMTKTLARCLRIVGIWVCVASNRPLESCACVEGLVSGHAKAWVEERLARGLSDLGSADDAEV